MEYCSNAAASYVFTGEESFPGLTVVFMIGGVFKMTDEEVFKDNRVAPAHVRVRAGHIARPSEGRRCAPGSGNRYGECVSGWITRKCLPSGRSVCCATRFLIISGEKIMASCSNAAASYVFTVESFFSGWPVVFMMGRVSEMTEEEVLTRIQELHLRMFRYAWSVLGNRQDAEDVLELAQTRIWKARNQCRDPEKFESWAFAILNNKIKDHFRKHKRRLEKESFVDKTLLETLGDGSPDPERRLIQFELLQEALSSLNDKEKKAVLLREEDGLSNSEIADQTEQRESSVRSQYSRGIRKIKKAIEGRKEPNSYAGK